MLHTQIPCDIKLLHISDNSRVTVCEVVLLYSLTAAGVFFKLYDVCHCSDTLTKEEFHLKQNVEPFIHYKEKHATFECITRENIEAVAAKVC